MEIGKYRILLPGLLNEKGDMGMQDFSRQLCLINEFYNRHKPIIDALAKDDEMFRAVKEIAETKDQPAISK